MLFDYIAVSFYGYFNGHRLSAAPGWNDNLNLIPNDNPILTPPIAGTGVIPHLSVIIQFQCVVPLITNSDPRAVIDSKRIFIAALVNQKAADQRQLLIVSSLPLCGL